MGLSKRFAWGLLALGLAAAIAATFGPSTRWLGVDIGATGAALFMIVMGAAIWMFAVRGDTIFPDDMSVAERRAWVGLVFIGIILLSFARHLSVMSASEIVPDFSDRFFGRHFVQRLIAMIIVWSVIAHLIGRTAGGVEKDERDLRLRHRADRVGDWAFTWLSSPASVCSPRFRRRISSGGSSRGCSRTS